jgi:Mlc titration factor MtfA (ptsG expression regulator)
MAGWLQRRRHRAIRAAPFLDAWRDIIDANVAYVAVLPPDDREALFKDVQVFLAEKRFEGCGGQVITDEVRVTIAAQACVLLLHRDDDDCYPNLGTIVVYPSSFVVPGGHRDARGVVDEASQARLGESWSHEIVVLAWDSVRAGAKNAQDGDNVVLHEFAHQLDQDGDGNGAPILPTRAMYGPWARVLGQAYEDLLADIEQHHRTLLDPYGAKNPAEFFAVATETFFEKPHAMQRDQPALYAQLQAFYAQDPASLTGS